MFSPRVWGLKGLNAIELIQFLVFPTCVGIERMNSLQRPVHTCFPHVCGD